MVENDSSRSQIVVDSLNDSFTTAVNDTLVAIVDKERMVSNEVFLDSFIPNWLTPTIAIAAGGVLIAFLGYLLQRRLAKPSLTVSEIISERRTENDDIIMIIDENVITGGDKNYIYIKCVVTNSGNRSLIIDKIQTHDGFSWISNENIVLDYRFAGDRTISLPSALSPNDSASIEIRVYEWNEGGYKQRQGKLEFHLSVQNRNKKRKVNIPKIK